MTNEGFEAQFQQGLGQVRETVEDFIDDQRPHVQASIDQTAAIVAQKATQGAVSAVINQPTGAASADGDIYTVRYWRRVLDAAIKTFATLLATMLGTPAAIETVTSGSVINLPWQFALTGAFVGTLINLLLNIGGRGFGNTADPSWINTK